MLAYIFGNMMHLKLMKYAHKVSTKEQFAKGKIKTPFVLGAIIDLRNCWNLPTSDGIKLLKVGYNGLKESLISQSGEFPINESFASRSLDRAVIEYIHTINKVEKQNEFDTVRGAFEEGSPVYLGTKITQKNHIQICVRNKSCIRGYFLPRPIKKYNPNL